MSQGCQYLNIERAPIEMQATDEDWAWMGRREGTLWMRAMNMETRPRRRPRPPSSASFENLNFSGIEIERDLAVSLPRLMNVSG